MTEHPWLIEAHISVPDAESAQRIASDVVARQLAACAQILGPMVSVYSWQGEVHQAEEWLLLLKTTQDAFDRLAEVVGAAHRYDVPEIIAVPVTHAVGEYESWVVKHSDGINDEELLGGA